MKNPQDLCRVEYALYRRQMLVIHQIAQTTNQRPSQIVRSLLDHALAENAPNTEEGR